MDVQNKYKDKSKFSRNQQKLKSNTTVEISFIQYAVKLLTILFI